MKYCYKCGSEIDDEAVVCPKCGVAQPVKSKNVDRGGFGWGLIGIIPPVLAVLFPIVGIPFSLGEFILYLIWRDEKPNRSRALLGGLIAGILVVAAIAVCFWIGYEY